MDPITWASLIPIIAKYGLPFAERLWQNAVNNVPVSPETWGELRALNETEFGTLVPVRPPS